MTRTALLIASLFALATWGPVLAQDQAAQPVYVQLFTTLDDHMNIQMTEERTRRTLDLIESYRRQHPNSGASCLLEFTGASSEVYAERAKSAGLVSRIRSLASSGAVEVGYNGANEPTERERPRPNFRRANTSEKRWLARLEAWEWFLAEFKDPKFGFPDPDRSGGLKRTQEVFGTVLSVAGVSRELGGDSELVHWLRKQDVRAMMPGLPESHTFPARNLNGYGGALSGLAEMLSPDPACAPEVFWQDDALRISDATAPGPGIIYLASGLDNFKKRLAGLDRSRPHVLRVCISHHWLHLKPDADKAMLASPIQWVYENPKPAALPEGAFLAPVQVDAAYARQQSALDWLVAEFFPANPGSRFLSVTEMTRLAGAALAREVTAEALREGTRNLLSQWRENNHPPSFARAGSVYFSLADMYSLLASALAESSRSGSLPGSALLRHVYGPFDMSDEQGPSEGEVTGADLAAACAAIRQSQEASWRPVPANRIPAWTTVGGLRLNAAQVLYLMASAYLKPGPDKRFRVRTCQMSSDVGMVLPSSRPRSDNGAVWTIKPAPLRSAR